MSRLLLDALLLYRGPNVEYRILPVKLAFSSWLESIKGEFKLLCVLIFLILLFAFDLFCLILGILWFSLNQCLRAGWMALPSK